MRLTKICPACKKTHNKPTIYCEAACYHSIPKSAETREKMSVAGRGKPRPKPPGFGERLSKIFRGKPKPWQQGERNVNFGNKAQGQPEARARFLERVKERGQPWTLEDRARHAETMRGPANKMRGRKHTPEMKAAMSATKKEQHRQGTSGMRLGHKISAPEKEIAKFLRESGVEFEQQFHIKGVPYQYDFWIPSLWLIVEFQGDFWHANPAKYPAQTVMFMPQSKASTTAEQIWSRDAEKRRQAEECGYRVVYVWESDFKKDGMKAIECLLKS